MNTGQNLPAPEERPTKVWIFPSWSQASVLLGAGLLLGFGGCAGFLSTMQSSSISGLFAILFFVALIMMFIGMIEFLILMVRALTGKNDG